MYNGIKNTLCTTLITILLVISVLLENKLEGPATLTLTQWHNHDGRLVLGTSPRPLPFSILPIGLNNSRDWTSFFSWQYKLLFVLIN